MNKVQDLFKIEGACDSKHILNTCAKEVPVELLDKIEAGCSLETLEEISRGFDVFKYRTQITIHGIFPELSTRRVGGYVNLTQNKNKSVGVRYTAIDRYKKSSLFSIIKKCDSRWVVVNNSTEYYIRMYVRLSGNKEQMLKQVDEVNALRNRIRKDLFYGSVEAYITQSLFGTYLNLDLRVNAFYEIDLMKIAESVLGITSVQIAIKLKEWQRKRDAEDAKYEMECEQRRIARERFEARAKQAREDYLAAHPEYKAVEAYNLQPGDVIVKINARAEGDEIVITPIREKISKSFGRIIATTINEDNTLRRHGRRIEPVYNGLIEPQKTASNNAVLSASTGAGKQTIKRAVKTPANGVKQANNGCFSLTIIDYSARAVAVVGDTKSIKSDLKALGGRFNPRLSCGAGWIFSKSKEAAIREKFNI